MKELIVGFDKFVNEMYTPRLEAEAGSAETSKCCGAPMMEDGTCTECGNYARDEFDQDPGDIEQMDPEVAAHAGFNEAKKKPGAVPPPPKPKPGAKKEPVKDTKFPNLKASKKFPEKKDDKKDDKEKPAFMKKDDKKMPGSKPEKPEAGKRDTKFPFAIKK